MPAERTPSIRRWWEDRESVDVPELPPEVPAIESATIVRHPSSGRDCLLATTEEGEHVAFAFEIESDSPGLAIVDAGLWLEAARESSPEHSSLRLEAYEEPRADDWLQAIIADPVGAEWLGRIKREHPDAYHKWFAQADYEEGGEEGAG
jgi:hypothetical protein